MINATAISLTTIKENIILSRFLELVTAPYHHPELLWITIPLIAALILMSIYFGRYKKEKLGWNTAVGNTMALLFVAMDILHHIYNGLAEPSIQNMILQNFREVMVVIMLGIISLWLFMADFFHVLPKKMAFMASSYMQTSLFAYIAIVLIYTDIVIDKYTLFGALLLYIAIVFFVKIIKLLIPTYYTKMEKKMIWVRHRKEK
ncbi:hypothetical protein GOV06_04995 [Candidatus Woesearchaeota archaeon]|nr:hypothetical protein [Candidatus Woesearchaeota archaeon]